MSRLNCDGNAVSNNPAPELSIIIPALNEAHWIGETLDAVSRLSVRAEVIVVDGGSDDGTREIAATHGARVLTSEPGRGEQMHRGASAAHGAVLWFLHADTIVPADGVDHIISALRDPQIVAGNFEVHFNGRGRAARFMTWLYPQLRRLGLCYGDSAIFVRREPYEKAGGFKSFPIFEDLDLLRGLRKLGGMAHLHATVATSSRRFEERNFAVMFARWVGLQVLFWFGVRPRTLGRFYAPVRRARARTLDTE